MTDEEITARIRNAVAELNEAVMSAQQQGVFVNIESPLGVFQHQTIEYPLSINRIWRQESLYSGAGK